LLTSESASLPVSSSSSSVNMDMEIVDGLEVGKKTLGVTYFHHTKFICQRKGQEDDFYYGIGNYHFADATPEHVRALRLIKIPNHLIYPKYEDGLTIAPDPLPPNVYIKTPRLVHFGDSRRPLDLSVKFLNEARKCEVLKNHPHRNVATYHGCIVKDGYIKGLCFAWYPLNLEKRSMENIPIDVNQTVKFLKRAVKHLHALGFAHNNIHPTHIMMDGENPVLIDFGSTLAFGQRLDGWRAGSEPWIPPKARISDAYNDYYGVTQIYHWLRNIPSYS
jgi:serine/threonine protein kinase